MSTGISFPGKINSIVIIGADNSELGVLTYGSVHHYLPMQDAKHVSLTMTKQGMDGYNCPSGHSRNVNISK
tara:strand:+ start:4578 stop:4790 length:213 start_codon:yes stop_codon:yes gene_type:complete